jgi:hypothetical protein
VAGDGFRLAPDAAVARRLWALSERLTGVRFAELDHTSPESGPEHLR